VNYRIQFLVRMVVVDSNYVAKVYFDKGSTASMAIQSAARADGE
jgi:hypothetical protein